MIKVYKVNKEGRRSDFIISLIASIISLSFLYAIIFQDMEIGVRLFFLIGTSILIYICFSNALMEPIEIELDAYEKILLFKRKLKNIEFAINDLKIIEKIISGQRIRFTFESKKTDINSQIDGLSELIEKLREINPSIETKGL